ncbi:MAG: EAL domain-containing protein [Pseudomonadota bacterium]
MAKAQNDPSSPLELAVSMRDRNVMHMLSDALLTNDTFLAFQPIVRAGHPSQIGFVEGLMRVRDGTGRIVPARDFMPQVETTELGRRMDVRALELGLQALSAHPNIRLSINMSARSIGYPDWTRVLERGLAEARGIAERLILEITESSAMLMPDLVTVFMDELQERGVSFALDDFGAGYTSFRFLREFFFDAVKIDGQFIEGVASNSDNQVLTRALVSIAEHFEMFTVAEMVTNADDARFLREAGVDYLQGYLFGVPRPEIPARGLSNLRSA